MKSITIIIPVKDEEVGLKYLLENYQKSSFYGDKNLSFIFVIDGRTGDSSRKIASHFSDKIIDQYYTHGKGSAVRQALKVWDEQQSDFVIFMDADGSYSFNDVENIVKALNDGADVSSGSRFIGEVGIPKGMGRLHNFGNRFLSKVSSIRNRRKISDLCTGLWGFQRDAINKIQRNSKGFDLEAEIAGKIRKSNLSHVEIGIKWSARKGGMSKLKSFKDGSIILLRIIRT